MNSIISTSSRPVQTDHTTEQKSDPTSQDQCIQEVAQRSLVPAAGNPADFIPNPVKKDSSIQRRMENLPKTQGHGSYTEKEFIRSCKQRDESWLALLNRSAKDVLANPSGQLDKAKKLFAGVTLGRMDIIKEALESVNGEVDTSSALDQQSIDHTETLAIAFDQVEAFAYLRTKGLSKTPYKELLDKAVGRERCSIALYLLDQVNATSDLDTMLLSTVQAKPCENPERREKFICHLIEKGANVNAKTKENEPLLIDRIRNSDLAAAEILVEKGADLRCLTEENETVFMLVCEQGWIDLARELHWLGAADINAKSNGGYTALMFACCKTGNIGLVRYLVEELGANVGAQADKNWTALFSAAAAGQTEIADYLVRECKADPKGKTTDGKIILSLLVPLLSDLKVATLCAYLVDQGVQISGSSLLPLAVKWKHESLVKKLVDLKADVNEGGNALAFAVGDNQLGLARLLLDKKADINSVSMHYVLEKILPTWNYSTKKHEQHEEFIPMLKLLLAHKANPNTPNRQGLCALYEIATRLKDPAQMLQLFSESGADLQGALNELIEQGKPVKDLLSLKADPYGADLTGDTPLMAAAAVYKCSEKDLEPYINEKTINATNRLGQTALMKAVNRIAPPETLSFLLKKGADATLKDAKGVDVAKMAEELGDARALELFSHTPQTLAKTREKELLRIAGRYNSISRVKELIAQGTSVNIQDEEGNTPVILSVKEQLRIEKLVSFEPNDIPKAENAESSSDLDVPSELDEWDKLKPLEVLKDSSLPDLIAAGANLNEKNKKGKTALDYAINKLNQEAVKFLLDNGAEIPDQYQNIDNLIKILNARQYDYWGFSGITQFEFVPQAFRFLKWMIKQHITDALASRAKTQQKE